MDPVISVIIPVYNVEDYLACCLDSIVGQTYKNLDIILVDDGSTDNSGKICDQYAAEDKRISVLHKENGGLSQARNCGIEVARGEYIAFVDSDDYVALDFVEVLYSHLERNQADFAMCRYRKFHGEVCDAPESEGIVIRILTREQAKIDFLGMKYPMYAHGKLFRTELFANVRFPEGRIYEDVPTLWSVLKQTNKVAIVYKVMYFYRQRSGSIVNMEFSTKRLDQNRFAEYIYNEVQEDLRLEQAAAVRCFFSALDSYSLVPRCMKNDKEWVEEQLRKYSKRMKNNPYAGRKMKLLAMLTQCSMNLLYMVVRAYKRRK